MHKVQSWGDSTKAIHFTSQMNISSSLIIFICLFKFQVNKLDRVLIHLKWIAPCDLNRYIIRVKKKKVTGYQQPVYLYVNKCKWQARANSFPSESTIDILTLSSIVICYCNDQSIEIWLRVVGGSKISTYMNDRLAFVSATMGVHTFEEWLFWLANIHFHSIRCNIWCIRLGIQYLLASQTMFVFCIPCKSRQKKRPALEDISALYGYRKQVRMDRERSCIFKDILDRFQIFADKVWYLIKFWMILFVDPFGVFF